MTCPTPEARAASLLTAAVGAVTPAGARMTVSLRLSSGSSVAVTGIPDNGRVSFSPREVSTLLAWLADAVVTDDIAVLTVSAELDADGWRTGGWAWCIGTGAALNVKEATKHFPDQFTEVWGAEDRIGLDGDRGDTGTGLSVFADEVNSLLAAHREPTAPPAGREITLRTAGTITFHLTATDVPAARRELEKFDCEDFDVDLRTPQGHLISHITVLEPEDAELIGVDDVPADELPDSTTN